MAIVAIILGAIMIDLGYRGTEHEFAAQLGKDLSIGHFWAWVASITVIGALGYYSPARRVSDLLLFLIILGLALSQKGIYANFAGLMTNPPTPAPAVPMPSFSTSSSSSSSGIGGDIGMATSILGAL